VSESVDTQQASIVFLGRDSFRMQIVGGDEGPEPAWESKTQRIIERRKNDRERRADDRRKSTSAPALAEWPELPAQTSLRRTIILISFVTFVSGAVAATVTDKLRRRAMASARTAQAERVLPVTAVPAQPAPPPVVAQPAAAVVATQPASAPPAPPVPTSAPIVEPLPQPEPEFLQARTAPETASIESEPAPQKRPAAVKAAPTPRVALTPALRPRRAAAATTNAPATATAPTAPRALNVDPFDEPRAKATAKPAARAQWVDPFAE
jgi:hypothetical protein